MDQLPSQDKNLTNNYSISIGQKQTLKLDSKGISFKDSALQVNRYDFSLNIFSKKRAESANQTEQLQDQKLIPMRFQIHSSIYFNDFRQKQTLIDQSFNFEFSERNKICQNLQKNSQTLKQIQTQSKFSQKLEEKIMILKKFFVKNTPLSQQNAEFDIQQSKETDKIQINFKFYRNIVLQSDQLNIFATDNQPDMSKKVYQKIKLIQNSLKVINSQQKILSQNQRKIHMKLILEQISRFQKQILDFVDTYFLKDKQTLKKIYVFIDLYLNYMQDLQYCQQNLHQTAAILKLFQKKLIELVLTKLQFFRSNVITQERYHNWYYYMNLLNIQCLDFHQQCTLIIRLLNYKKLENNQRQIIQSPRTQIFQCIGVRYRLMLQDIYHNYRNSSQLFKYFLTWVQSLSRFNKIIIKIDKKYKANQQQNIPNLCHKIFQSNQSQKHFNKIINQILKIKFTQNNSNSFAILQKHSLLDLVLKLLQKLFHITNFMSRQNYQDNVKQMGIFFCGLIDQNINQQKLYKKFLKVLPELFQKWSNCVYKLKLSDTLHVIKSLCNIFFQYYNESTVETHYGFIGLMIGTCKLVFNCYMPESITNSLLEIPNQQDICFLVDVICRNYIAAKSINQSYFIGFDNCLHAIRKLLHLYVNNIQAYGDQDQLKLKKSVLIPYLQNLKQTNKELFNDVIDPEEGKGCRKSILHSYIILQKLLEQVTNKLAVTQIKKGTPNNLIFLTNINILVRHDNHQKFQTQFKLFRNTLLEIKVFQLKNCNQFQQDSDYWKLVINFMAKFRKFLIINQHFNITPKMMLFLKQNSYLSEQNFSNIIKNVNMIQNLLYDKKFDEWIGQLQKNKNPEEIIENNITYKRFIKIISYNLKLIAATSEIFHLIFRSFVPNMEIISQQQKSQQLEKKFQQIVQKICIQILRSRGLNCINQSGIFWKVKILQIVKIRNFQKVVFLNSVFKLLNLSLFKKLLKSQDISPFTKMKKNQSPPIQYILSQTFNFGSLITAYSDFYYQHEYLFRLTKVEVCPNLTLLKPPENIITVLGFQELIAKFHFIRNILLLLHNLKCIPINQSAFKFQQIIKKTRILEVSFQLVEFIYCNFMEKIPTYSQIQSNQILDSTFNQIYCFVKQLHKCHSSNNYSNLLQLAPICHTRKKLGQVAIDVIKIVSFLERYMSQDQKKHFASLSKKFTKYQVTDIFQLDTIQMKIQTIIAQQTNI